MLQNQLLPAQDNDMEKTDKLLPEPSTEGSELDDYHPCEVAKGAGGVFGSFGGGDGSTAPEPRILAWGAFVIQSWGCPVVIFWKGIRHFFKITKSGIFHLNSDEI